MWILIKLERVWSCPTVEESLCRSCEMTMTAANIRSESNMSSKPLLFRSLANSHCLSLQTNDIREALHIQAQAAKSISFNPGQSQSLECDCSSRSKTTQCQNVFHCSPTVTADYGVWNTTIKKKKSPVTLNLYRTFKFICIMHDTYKRSVLCLYFILQTTLDSVKWYHSLS